MQAAHYRGPTQILGFVSPDYGLILVLALPPVFGSPTRVGCRATGGAVIPASYDRCWEDLRVGQGLFSPRVSSCLWNLLTTRVSACLGVRPYFVLRELS